VLQLENRAKDQILRCALQPDEKEHLSATDRKSRVFMRVLLVSSGSGSRGGGEIFLDYLGMGLTDRGHEVLMWIPDHPRMDELAERCARFARIYRANYLNTYDHPARSLSTCFNRNAVRRVAREWQALGPDVIHINKQNLEDGLDLLRAARRCLLPSVCTIHLTQNARYLRARAGWLRDWIARRELSQYKGVLVAVQEGRRLALSNFLVGRGCTKTIFNGVPCVDAVTLRSMRDAKRKELGLTDRDFLVLGLGRLEQQKRPLLFLRIAEELHNLVPDARFIWVGDGKLGEEWHKTVARAGLEDVISCAGWRADVQPYLVASDLLLHVAEFEGLPFAVLEAMAAGLACAVTRDLAHEIPLFNEQNVLFVDEVRGLAEKLRQPLAVSAIAEGGRHLVESQLSMNRMAESYEKLYVDAKRDLQCAEFSRRPRA
jgi:glycosyltransferase involved in cell wall biosynthesis